jgi:hypothetical protein
MQTVTLTAVTGSERTRQFHVLDCHFNTQNGHLTLHCRDGRICLQLVGAWTLDVRPAPVFARAHSVEEAERIHDGKTAVVLSTH